MERHRCKLCSKMFGSGRALGGHMRSHLAILPIPCKKTSRYQFSDRSESDSSSSFGENPALNDAGDQVLDAASVVLQETGSETESTHNPPRSRPKRASRGKMTSCGSRRLLHGVDRSKKWVKRVDRRCGYVRVKSESVTEFTESTLVSSVSDACLDEEVALCLMMLSRDVWEKRVGDNSVDSAELTQSKRTRPNGSSVSLNNRNMDSNNKIYKCPFCGKVFGSGQALGGHKRSHLLGSSSTNYTSKEVASTNENNDNNNNNIICNVDYVDKVIGDANSFILDLNLPAPLDDGEDIS